MVTCERIPVFLFFFGGGGAPEKLHNIWARRNGENMLDYIQILEYIPIV